MRKLNLTFLSSLFFLALGFLNATAQQVFKTTPTSVIAYLEYLPQDYDTNSDKYPIVFFLHGIGERGPNSTDPAVLSGSIQDVTTHGPPKHVKLGTEFPFILISPQLKSNYGQWTSAYVMEVINHCKTYLRIDERRIYLTGLSLGGGGTWVAAQDHPELFAAIAPVCGGYNSPSSACKLAAENLPVWAFHGDKDTTVPLSRSQNMVNAINACTPKPSPLAMLTVYAGVAHNAWDKAYKPDSTIHDPNVYEWLMSFTNTINKSNRIPVANAGPDKTVGLVTATVTGSGTDSDGSIAIYTWTKMSGPSATIANRNSAALSLSGLAPGEYVFKLQVTDNNGNTDSDYVTVTADETNEAPVSNAGPNKTFTLPLSSISITGSGTDADGSIVSYEWSKVSGGTVTMSNTGTPVMTATGMIAGSYVFRLTVTDNEGAKDTDDMLVKINAPVAPIVSAGADKLVKLPTTSTSLIGTATDVNGTIVSFAWTKISGGDCAMTRTTSSTLRLSNLVSGVYTFRLTATDNEGNKGSDDVVLTVDDPPKVNAGADINVTTPLTALLYLNGQATDSDGSIIKYQWSKYSGPNAVVQNTGSATLTIKAIYEGVYVYKLVVTDNLGAQGSDYITITVTKSSVTSRMGIAVSSDDTNEAVLELNPVEKPLLGKMTATELKNCKVLIYSSEGEQVYFGDWSEEKNYEIFQKGFYIYNVIRDGKRIDSGKIYKTDI